jgi:hypothetical protein
MPLYDTNRILVTITRQTRSLACMPTSRAGWNSVLVPEPDEHGRMDIGIDQERNDAAAEGIQAMLDREWPDWRITPTSSLHKTHRRR